MSSRPTIILPVQADAAMRLRQTNGTVEAFNQDIHSGLNCDVVIPGQSVRIYPHDLPKLREREKLAAARFAIEDRTAVALEAQHIVIGQSGDARLAVIDSAELNQTISKLESLSIEVADIYADFDWIAPRTEPVVLEDRIIFTGPEGYTIDLGWADDELLNQSAANWQDLTPREDALSLRQGHFARRSGFFLPFASLSKIAALLAVTSISWLALQGAQARAISKQASQLSAQTAALYTQATGQAAPSNPALAVTRALKSGPKGGSDFLPLLSALNTMLTQSDAISVQIMSFDASKAQLSLRLIYPNFESAGELETAASRNGNQFRPGGVREQGGELIGDAVFELGAPS